MKNIDKIIELAKKDKIEDLKKLLIDLTKDENGFNPVEYKFDEDYFSDKYKITFNNDGVNLVDTNCNLSRTTIKNKGVKAININYDNFHNILASNGLNGEINCPIRLIDYYIDDKEGTIQVSLKSDKQYHNIITVKYSYDKGSLKSLRQTFVKLLDNIWSILNEYNSFTIDSLSEYIDDITNNLYQHASDEEIEWLSNR